VTCSIPYTGDGLLLPVFTCYPWEMALNFGLDVSLDNLYHWKGIRQKAREMLMYNKCSDCCLNSMDVSVVKLNNFISHFIWVSKEETVDVTEQSTEVTA
jgi:hypothetical protein